MANELQLLFDSAVSCANNDKIKLDKDKASALSHRLGKIASAIEMAAAQIEGPISETQHIWTGQAAESFFAELTELVKEAKEIGRKVGENRQKIESAVTIIMAADKKNLRDAEDLSEQSAFKIK